jgi:hypothetical protein
VKPYSRISKQDREKAKEKGINRHTFRGRIYRGWTMDEALEIVPRKKKECEHNNIYESKIRNVKMCVNCRKIFGLKIDDE